MIEKLQAIGLTKTEARIYIFLLEYKEAKAGEICGGLNLHSSHIYGTMERILKKGLISYKVINNIKVFYPADPEFLLSKFQEEEKLLEQKKKDLQNFIGDLKKLSIQKSNIQNFKYFEGVLGVKSMISEFVEGMQENGNLYIFSAPLAYNRWNAFLLDHFHPKRVAKKVKQKLILPKSLKIHGEERAKFPLIEFKYTDQEFPSEFGVSGNMVYFLSESNNKPYAVLYQDTNFANTQKMIFENMWEQSN